MSDWLVKPHVHRAVILALGLGGLSLHASAQSWAYCAQEDEVCQVRGEAVVRYGSNGQYAYRKTNGPVLCGNQNFGDPAPKQRKDCSVSYHPNAWREANSAGQYGNPYPSSGYPAPHQPAYPAGGSVYPAPAAVTGGGGEWRTCASEDEFCSFRGAREVRFGAEGRYHVRTAVDGVACHVREFGDPNDGVRKHCQVRTHGGHPYQGSYNTYPAPVTGYDSRHWRICAEEDGLCTPPRNATVRFGADGRYAYAERVQGSIPCSIYTFGDPMKGTRKVCEYSLR
jgi:hypothetical protein